MTPAARNVILGAPFDPYRLTNNAAAYSLAGAAGDSTYLVDGSNRLYYVADRSGNSAVNGLILPLSTSNYASFTALTAFGTGNFSVSAKVRVAALATDQAIFGSLNTGFAIRIQTDGTLRTSKPGTADNVASTGTVTAQTDAVITYTRSGTTGTYYINGATAGATVTDNRDYAVGVSLLGLTDTSPTRPFGGIIWNARVYSVALSAAEVAADAAGTVQANCTFNIDFSLFAKLAASPVTAITGQSVTINTSAIALPARIHGARDLYQGLTASMPTFSVSGGYNIATFDGTADYLKSAPFSLSQPESVYFTGSQVTWTLNDYLFDGDGSSVMQVAQLPASSPTLQMRGGGTAGGDNNDLVAATRGVVRAIFNGASSTIGVNRVAGVANASSGTSASNGFTLAARGNATQFGNITWSEALLRSAADADALQLRIAAFEMRKWGVS